MKKQPYLFLVLPPPLKNEDEPVLLIDIGGGSTEFVLGQRGRVIGTISTNMGSVRVFERYLEPVIADAKCGDGSLDPRQTPGMAKALIKATSAIDELIDEADQKLGFRPRPYPDRGSRNGHYHYRPRPRLRRIPARKKSMARG